jgi:hypothetical protein
MSIGEPTRSTFHSFETELKELLQTAHTHGDDPQGTYTLPVSAEGEPAYTVEITAESTAADEDTDEIKHSYCLDCGWSVSTAECPSQEISSLIVQHAVEAGHDIDSDYIAVEEETDNTNRPSSPDRQ